MGWRRPRWLRMGNEGPRRGQDGGDDLGIEFSTVPPVEACVGR
jgi:hypothetical protein